MILVVSLSSFFLSLYFSVGAATTILSLSGICGAKVRRPTWECNIAVRRYAQAVFVRIAARPSALSSALEDGKTARPQSQATVRFFARYNDYNAPIPVLHVEI